MFNNKKDSPQFLLVGILLQFVILLTMAGLAARPLIVGETGLLRVIPVDPRDAFRGDYVTLGYEGITNLGSTFSHSPSEKAVGERAVYVPLTREPDGKHWKPEKPTLERPASGIYLWGRLQTSGQAIFGIESYYIQNQTGKAYETALHDKHLSAEIAVTSDGQAAVKRLVIEPASR